MSFTTLTTLETPIKKAVLNLYHSNDLTEPSLQVKSEEGGCKLQSAGDVILTGRNC